MAYDMDEMLMLERELQDEMWRECGELAAARREADREWEMEVRGEYGMEQLRAADNLLQVTVTEVELVSDDDVPF